MQDFRCNYIENKYGDEAEMLLTDTNSQRERFIWLQLLSKWFKVLQWHKKHIHRSMNDETCGVPIKSFAGINPKMYTFIIEDNHESKKAKGSKTNVNDDELKYEN